MSKRQLLLWLTLFGVASLVAYFDALGSYASAYHNGIAYLRWDVALSYDMTKWNLWVLLAPLVLRLGRRFPVDRLAWSRRVPVYVFAGASVAITHTVLHVFVHFVVLFGVARLGSLPARTIDFVATKYYVVMADFLLGALIYSLILASGHALDYYRRAQANELRAAHLEAQLAQAQLQALKMQLHPHFLFNTLHSISAHLRDTMTARRMIARLGDFLRLTLENVGAQEVTLRREMEFLRCYLDIERTRFRDRLEVAIDIEPAAWDALVPNLLLQPIVENSIKHGFAARSAPGKIDVRAGRRGDRLWVQVVDNGCGLPHTNGAITGDKEGVGLTTTRARLEHLYPAAHRLTLENKPEGGAAVTVEMPFAMHAHTRTIRERKRA